MVAFSYLMRVLAERSLDAWPDAQGVLRPKLTQEERGTQCYLWAQEYPALADDLQAVARQYGALMYMGR
jgi:hypothetical protein